MHASSTGKFDLTVGGKTAEDIIVAYPMENTLRPTSELYYYATGIAIVGYYYVGGSGAGTRMVYLGYLRHQGDLASYDINSSATELSKTATMGETKAMNFGIVRNNIYRVSIESISPITSSDGTIKIKIEEEKWRHVDNPEIYI